MALMPEPVNTRKIALVREYVDESELGRVTLDGFTDEYFTVIDVAPEVEGAEVRSLYESGEVPKHRVYWRDERDRERAQAAREGDFRETFGALPRL